jgi:hypothetical protein
MSYFLKYEDDDCIDLSEFRQPKYRFRCSDRMCGATDCSNCYSSLINENNTEDDNDTDTDN